MQIQILLLFLLNILVLSCGQTAVLILARGGSKGVRLKNLQKVGGVSLLGRAINTSKLAGLKDVTVSTDHPLIALETIIHGATAFQRSKVTATDWAPSIWGASEFLASRIDVKVLILLQATSPFIQAKQIQQALKKKKEFDCVFSVTRSHKLRWREDFVGRSRISPVNFKLYARPRRQDWNGELLETGAFYISGRHLIETGYFQNNNCTFVEVSTIESLEVDNYHDLQVANALLRANLV